MEYSIEDLERIMFDGVAEVECPVCGDVRTVEPDAENYDCWTEGCDGKINSPLITMGLI